MIHNLLHDYVCIYIVSLVVIFVCVSGSNSRRLVSFALLATVWLKLNVIVVFQLLSGSEGDVG